MPIKVRRSVRRKNLPQSKAVRACSPSSLERPSSVKREITGVVKMSPSNCADNTLNERRRKRIASRTRIINNLNVEKCIDEYPSNKKQRNSYSTDLRLELENDIECALKSSVRKGSRDMRENISTIVTPSPGSSSKYATINLTSSEPSAPATTFTSLDAILCAENELPEDVVNIDKSVLQFSCDHDPDHCSSSSLTASYLSTYSQDHDKYLENSEEHSFSTDSVSTSFSIATSVPSSPLSSSSQSPVVRRSTRRRRKNTCVDKDIPFSYSTINIECSDECIIPKPNEEINYLSWHQHLKADMRAVLMDWLIDVAGEYQLLDVTLHTAVGLVDRSIARAVFVRDGESPATSIGRSALVINRETLQLLGCACMMIAGKLHETSPPHVSDYTYISASSYSNAQVIDMELNICSALQFRFQGVTPYNFVDRLLRASYASSVSNIIKCAGTQNDPMSCMVEYFLEIAILYYKYVSLKPSLVAASAVYLARATLGIKDGKSGNAGFWSKTLEYYSGYELKELENPVRHLHRAHSVAEEGKQKTVYKKFATADFHRVSLKTVLAADDLGFP